MRPATMHRPSTACRIGCRCVHVHFWYPSSDMSSKSVGVLHFPFQYDTQLDPFEVPAFDDDLLLEIWKEAKEKVRL